MLNIAQKKVLFEVFDKEDAANKLDIPPIAFSVMSAVCSNDYGRNVKNIGLFKAYKIIRHEWDSLSRGASEGDVGRRLFDQFFAHPSVKNALARWHQDEPARDQAAFMTTKETALAVFTKQIETIMGRTELKATRPDYSERPNSNQTRFICGPFSVLIIPRKFAVHTEEQQKREPYASHGVSHKKRKIHHAHTTSATDQFDPRREGATHRTLSSATKQHKFDKRNSKAITKDLGRMLPSASL